MTKLANLGWNERFETEFDELNQSDWQPARLIRDNKISYGAVLGDGNEIEVTLGGTVYHEAETDADLPSVGDWVALEMDAEGERCDGVIRARLKRQTKLSRKAPGKGSEEQIIAANIDFVFVVTDAGQDLNLRRLERYFAVLSRCEAQSAVLLNKSDLFSSEENRTAKDQITALNPEATIHVISALEESGLEPLKAYLRKGITIALIGSSGVGKSSIVNQLLGEACQWTGEVNGITGKGMHTTSARELLPIPGGGMLIDNPGIREVQVWIDAKTLKESFADFDQIASQCKFHDCKHGADKGCAIREAIQNGTLPKERFINYLKLDDELERLKQRKKSHAITTTRRNKREKRSKSEKYNR